VLNQAQSHPIQNILLQKESLDITYVSLDRRREEIRDEGNTVNRREG